MRIFREYYSIHALFKLAKYPCLDDTLMLLRSRGKKLAVATYKPEVYALDILRHTGTFRYFDAVHGADADGFLKKSDIIKLCLDDIGCGKSEAVLIGDTVHDKEAAEEVGVRFIAVTYGFGFTRDDADLNASTYAAVCDSFRDILECV